MAKQIKGQLSLLPMPEDANQQTNAKARRNWENAFQRWSDAHGQDGTDSRGCCGYGSMCDWCEDNDHGKPCVRALNAKMRERGQQIDYSIRDFDAIWYGE